MEASLESSDCIFSIGHKPRPLSKVLGAGIYFGIDLAAADRQPLGGRYARKPGKAMPVFETSARFRSATGKVTIWEAAAS
jgi:hypothetical protein